MKILMTTAYRKNNKDYYNYFSENVNSIFKISWPLKIAIGLRFLKQNVPELEILEFPTWQEYINKLKEGWDAVAFSFFTWHTPRILEMVDYARKAGIKEIWGGNYGILNPAIEHYFDKKTIGYSEHNFAKLLNKKIERIKHPPLISQWYIEPLPVKIQRVGFLFTQRGCPMKCSFCQTPIFNPEPSPVPLESIDEVLAYYKTHGVDWIVIMDENFGVLKKHTEKVIELLGKHKIFWSVMTRADLALRNLDYWDKTNFMGAGVGVESINNEVLKKWNKHMETETVKELTEELHRRNRYIWGYYILGFEDATFNSTIEEINELYKYDIDYIQTTILTPFPMTPLWDYIDKKFGIFEKDWSKFDTKHLVWNHPHLSVSKLQTLSKYAFTKLNDIKRHLRFIKRIYECYADKKASHVKATQFVFSFPLKSYKYKDENFFFTK